MKKTKVVRRPYRPDVVVVDGNALAFRSLYSHETLSVKIKGKTVFTGMAYGFVRMLAAVKKQFHPKSFVIVWDGGSKRKKEVFPAYKAKRKIVSAKMSFDDIISSLNMCRKMAKHLGIPQFRIFGEEGDDLMASFVAQNKGVFMLLTNDHDMFQLLEYPNVKMLKFGQKDARMWHAASFTREHEGLAPRHYPEFLAIVGDKTDEIPGVKGVGEVWAYKIFAQLPEPTLESLYENIVHLQVTPHVRSLLEQGRDDAFMFREIIVLKEDLELEPIYKPKLNRKRLERLMTKMKFRSLLENSNEMEIICSLGS